MTRRIRLFSTLFCFLLVPVQFQGETSTYFVEGYVCGDPEPGLLTQWQLVVGNAIRETFDSAEEMDPVRDGYRLSEGQLYDHGWWGGKDLIRITFYDPGTDNPKPVSGAMVSLFNLGAYELRAYGESGNLLAEISGAWGCERSLGERRWAGFSDPDGIASIEIAHGYPTIDDIVIAVGLPDPSVDVEYLIRNTERALSPEPVFLHSIATGEGVTVGTGYDDHRVLISRGRDEWSTISFDQTYRLRSVVYGSESFVMIDKHHFLRSGDGVHWEVVSKVEDELNTAIWSRDRFWVVGGRSIWSSIDGKSWSSTELDSTDEGLDLVTLFDDGTRLHALSGSEVHQRWISTDGVSWTLSGDDSQDSLSHAVDLASDGSVIVATARHPSSGSSGLAGANRLIVQRAGQAAFEFPSPISGVAHWSSVQYHDGRFTFFSDHGIASTDSGFGVWKLESSPGVYGRIAVVETDDGWLAGSEFGQVLARPFDSESNPGWEVLHDPPAVEFDFQDVAFGNGMFLVLDRGRNLYRSFSGRDWVPLPLPSARQADLVFVKDRFLWLDVGGHPLQSVDGDVWTPLGSNLRPVGVYSVAAGPDLWIALSRLGSDGQVEVFLSEDSETWERQDFLLGSGTDRVTYGNGVFVTSNLVSTDGKTWSVHEAMREGVRFSEDEFLSHDESGIFRSEDGLNWDYEQLHEGIRIADVLKIHGQTIALAEVGGYWRYLLVPGAGEWWGQDPFYPSGGGSSEFVSMEAGWGTVLAIGQDPGVVLQSDSAYSPARLANLSTRSTAGSGEAILIAGFVVEGTESTRILVRGVGPGLADFGVDGFLSDPLVRLMGESGLILANDNWFDGPQAETAAAMEQVGAFQLAAASLDAALVADVLPGAYSAQVMNQAEGVGVALAEVYQMGTEMTMLNLSSRAYVGSGESIAIGGLVVSGKGIGRFLVRAVGPGLGAFGVEEPLSDPLLEIRRGQTLVASNQGWDVLPNASVVAAAGASVGAFPLASGSADAALVVSLPPGAYTASVRGREDSVGIALLEIYLIE